MILEAFARYLQSAPPELSAESVLARWLWERLSIPPETAVDRVLHCEIGITVPRARGEKLTIEAGSKGRHYAFKGLSDSGRKLLNSLHQYALSYEQQKWARWVHGLKASDFKPHMGD